MQLDFLQLNFISVVQISSGVGWDQKQSLKRGNIKLRFHKYKFYFWELIVQVHTNLLSLQ